METRERRNLPKTRRGTLQTNLLDLHDACLRNARELLDEATQLLEHGHAARAYFIAFTALEEFGKSQIAADYFSEMVSDNEFIAAFRDHRMKLAYIERVVTVPDHPNGPWTIEYDQAVSEAKLRTRMDALYVRYDQDYSPIAPAESITSEDASLLIDDLGKGLEKYRQICIMSERIGTKAYTK